MTIARATYIRDNFYTVYTSIHPAISTLTPNIFYPTITSIIKHKVTVNISKYITGWRNL